MMRTAPAGPRGALSPARGLGGRLLVASIVASLVGLTASAEKAAAQVTYTEEGGTLGDGTRYLMRVPSNWNGTLIRDLDYASGANSDRYLYLLEKGYAVSGTARHERRWVGNYDPAREIRHLNTVLDVFEEHFRKPDRVIHYGCSGGGNVGLAIAEDFSDRVDGVISTGAYVPTHLMNTKMDKWFVLKALIAPDLRIVDLPHSSSLRPEYPELTFAWRQADQGCPADSGGPGPYCACHYDRTGNGMDDPDGAESGSERCSCASVQYVPDCSRWCRPRPNRRYITVHARERGPALSGRLSYRGTPASTTGSFSTTATSSTSERFVSCIRKPVLIFRMISSGSTRFPASRRTKRQWSGGVRPGEEVWAIRRFRFCGCTRSEIL